MRLPVVIGDLGEDGRDPALVAETSSALVFELAVRGSDVRRACDRTTGARSAEPGPTVPISRRPIEIAGDGVRLALRDRELCRFHADGWIESALQLRPRAQLVAADSFIAAFDVVESQRIDPVRLYV